MKNNHIRAVIFLVLASILWSTGGILIKLVDWNPVAIAGTRSGISALVMMLYMRKTKVTMTKQKPLVHHVMHQPLFYSSLLIK